MTKHTQEDHKLPKPTAHESNIYTKIQTMRDEFELRMLNIVAQLRAISIATHITPEQFLEAFHSAEKQNEYFQTLNKVEKEIIKKKEAEMEATKEKLAKAGVVPENEELKETIMGEGDKIV